MLASVSAVQSTLPAFVVVHINTASQLPPSQPVAQEHEQASAMVLPSEEPVALPLFCGRRGGQNFSWLML
jgi:hypothetical protein